MNRKKPTDAPVPGFGPTRQVPGETGEVLVIQTSAQKDGGCNFCPVNDGPIYMMQGKKRTMSVRFCPGCLRGVLGHRGLKALGR